MHRYYEVTTRFRAVHRLGYRSTSSTQTRAGALLQLRPPATGVPVDVTGWVRSARLQKHYSFLEVNDGSSAKNLQVVWPTDSGALPSDARSSAGTGSCVRIRGLLVPSPKPSQPVEVHADSVEVLGGVPADVYPLQKKVRLSS